MRDEGLEREPKEARVERRDRIVRIEQPTVNKVTVFLVAGAAVFVTLVLITRIEAAGFRLLLVAFLAGVLLYAYRSIEISAVADADGIEVRNLLRHRRLAWSEVASLTVGDAGKTAGTGIVVEAADGSTMPVEASWGAWHEGKGSGANARRCEEILRAIDGLRTHRGDESPDRAIVVDPIRVRPATPEDVAATVATIATARRETYDEILPGRVFDGADLEQDAEMLREIIDGAIPGAGCLVVERDGEIVGTSVFGPTRADGLDGYVEVYMIYVLAGEIGRGAGRRLVVRTVAAIRSSGARGIVGHVYVGNRALRDRLEAHGTAPHGDTQEQIWYGLPIKVVEYRLPFSPAPIP